MAKMRAYALYEVSAGLPGAAPVQTGERRNLEAAARRAGYAQALLVDPDGYVDLLGRDRYGSRLRNPATLLLCTDLSDGRVLDVHILDDHCSAVANAIWVTPQRVAACHMRARLVDVCRYGLRFGVLRQREATR